MILAGEGGCLFHMKKAWPNADFKSFSLKPTPFNAYLYIP